MLSQNIQKIIIDYEIILEAEDRLKNIEELYSIDEVKKDLNIK